MLVDPVPDLLAHATETLEQEFSALPAFAFESSADTGAVAWGR